MFTIRVLPVALPVKYYTVLVVSIKKAKNCSNVHTIQQNFLLLETNTDIFNFESLNSC